MGGHPGFERFEGQADRRGGRSMDFGYQDLGFQGAVSDAAGQIEEAWRAGVCRSFPQPLSYDPELVRVAVGHGAEAGWIRQGAKEDFAFIGSVAGFAAERFGQSAPEIGEGHDVAVEHSSFQVGDSGSKRLRYPARMRQDAAGDSAQAVAELGHREDSFISGAVRGSRPLSIGPGGTNANPVPGGEA